MDQLACVAIIVIVLIVFLSLIHRWERAELKLRNSIERSSVRKVLPSFKTRPGTKKSLTFDELLDSVSDIEWPSEIQEKSPLSFCPQKRNDNGSTPNALAGLGDLVTPVCRHSSSRPPVFRTL